MMSNNNLINEDKYGEIKYLDELLRELQNETLNEDWGYWHFGLLNLKDGTDLAGRIYDALIEILNTKTLIILIQMAPGGIIPVGMSTT